MAAGWPEVGYVCQPAKRLLRRGGGSVGWCGLLFHLDSAEVSVEWARMRAAVRAIEAATRQGSIAGLVGFTHRLMDVLRQRTPFTAFCARINSKPRVVQTVYEMGLIWSRRVLRQVKLTLRKGLLLDGGGAILARPLNAFLRLLRRLCAQRHARLVACNSRSAIASAEVDLCAVFALHRVLQGALRSLLANGPAAPHPRGVAALSHPWDADPNFQIQPSGRSRGRSHRIRERRVWWVLTKFVSQRLSRLLRRAARTTKTDSHVDPDGGEVSSTGLSVVELLVATGPQSISRSAVAALKL
ncbi:unnamed protein product [Phytomonas sp. Hart1]|nr:unnamed protein product [Phytomonas sp. Hart1]|eukprot:CCW69238.1 unnamed protein product [Phytomonas sp. isolate Hart1]